MFFAFGSLSVLRAQEQSAQAKSTGTESSTRSNENPPLPRGKKLILKDGTFQLVREFQIESDRVRYWSIEDSQWEELPVSLVDWDKTKEVEAEEAARDNELVTKLHKIDVARKAEPLDIDASLEVAPGIFLPPGEGLFSFDGKVVKAMSQAETESKLNKGSVLKQVLIPVPIVPTRHTISVAGAHATFRVTTGQPEFYMRTADAREPEMDLIRTKVHKDSRSVENVDQLFKQTAEKADTLALQKWQVAKGVYRFTMGQVLPPGEYVFAERVKEGFGYDLPDKQMALYVWDFGVDPAPKSK